MLVSCRLHFWPKQCAGPPPARESNFCKPPVGFWTHDPLTPRAQSSHPKKVCVDSSQGDFPLVKNTRLKPTWVGLWGYGLGGGKQLRWFTPLVFFKQGQTNLVGLTITPSQPCCLQWVSRRTRNHKNMGPGVHRPPLNGSERKSSVDSKRYSSRWILQSLSRKPGAVSTKNAGHFSCKPFGFKWIVQQKKVHWQWQLSSGLPTQSARQCAIEIASESFCGDLSFQKPNPSTKICQCFLPLHLWKLHRANFLKSACDLFGHQRVLISEEGSDIPLPCLG